MEELPLVTDKSVTVLAAADGKYVVDSVHLHPHPVVRESAACMVHEVLARLGMQVSMWVDTPDVKGREAFRIIVEGKQ